MEGSESSRLRVTNSIQVEYNIGVTVTYPKYALGGVIGGNDRRS